MHNIILIRNVRNHEGVQIEDNGDIELRFFFN
jgi:hypothetical protein